MLRWIGVLLVLFGLASLIASLPNLGSYAEGPVEVSLTSEGFSGLASEVPKEELDVVFNLARDTMASRSASARFWRGTAELVGWFAFVLGGVVTIVTGYLGRGEQDPAKVAAALKKKVKLSKIVGVIAATATVCTGASAKLKDLGEDQRKRAVDLREALLGAQADLSKAETAQEVRAILETLRADSVL